MGSLSTARTSLTATQSLAVVYLCLPVAPCGLDRSIVTPAYTERH